jgi:RAB protein geranylgeranyltransferase component A
MKFFNFVSSPLTELDRERLQSQTFDELMVSFGLSVQQTTLITNGIAFSNRETSALAAFEVLHEYVLSIGRYGKSPWLYPIYGTSELAQAFCRFSAVCGGIHILGYKTIDYQGSDLHVKLPDETEHIISTKNVIKPTGEVANLARATLILRHPYFGQPEVSPDGVDLLVFPHQGRRVLGLQLSSGSQCCPEATCKIIYIPWFNGE